MSFLHVHAVLETALPSNLKIVALVIAEMADLESGEAWPSYDSIARRASLQRRQAIYSVARLVDMGVLSPVGKRKCPSGYTNIWRFNMAMLESLRGASDCTGAPECTGGVHSTAPEGCTPLHGGGALHCTQTVIEPSIEPSLNRQRRKRARLEPEPEVYPAGLNVPAWLDWIAYRKKARLKRYSTDAAMKRLAGFPEDVQAKAVEQSIAQEWQGLFPEKVASSKARDKIDRTARAADEFLNG